MKKRLPFQFTCLLSLFFIMGFLSCGRTPSIPDHLDDDFPPGTAEGLYRIQDLKVILSETATKPGKDSKSDKQTLSTHETILSTKRNLYESNTKANVFSLKKLLQIHTSAQGKKVKISSGLNISIDPKIPFLNEYELLDYTIEEPKTKQQKILKKLLGKIRNFKGFPNTDYYILPHLVGNYLILYKLAPPDKIPYNELPLAKRVGDMLAVPFVGYSVKYCHAVKILRNKRKTLKSRPLCKGVPPNKPVKYIRLLERDKQVFSYLQKLNFFQRDFFNGEWFHFQTLVRSPGSGDSSIEHPYFKTARLVKFHPSIGKMDVVEVNQLKQDDEKRALFIPVKWTDYEIARDSENLHRSFSERLKEDILEMDRPYLQIKFNELVNNEFKYGGEGGKSLKAVAITEDYISFDIEITAKGRVAYLMKYAFKRYIKNQSYIEKKWFRKDSLLFFPLPHVKRKYYQDPADHTERDEDRFERTTRFDPNLKEILWYFSEHSTQLKWIRDLGHEAVVLLNKALKEAGKESDNKIKIRLDKSGLDKEVGDIRYNILNLILSEGEESEHFRLGPNIANPITGEIISSTANVWLNRIFSKYISLVRRYIRFHIYPPAWKMKPFSKETVDFIHENKETNNLQCSDLSQRPMVLTPFLHEKIQSVCKEVSDFIEREQGKKVFHPNNSSLQDDDVINSCAQKLAREKILHSILHSMLHSLGLKDMPSASVDKDNFYKPNEIEKLFGHSFSEMTTESHPDPPQYSSVMDHIDLEYPVLSVPGKLDIAALRFLYFDKVERKQGGFLHIPSGVNVQKSILEAAASEGHLKEDLKEYEMCGLDSNHPLFCDKNDYGISPLEIVLNGICKVHNYTMSQRNRYDSKKIEQENSVPNSIKKLYDKWQEFRDNILAREGKSILEYDFLNPDHITEYNQVIKKAKEHPNINSYYMVREPIFDYFKRIAFAPAKHCIYKKERDGGIYYHALALENIEEKILREYPENSEKVSEVFMSCSSPIVKSWTKKNKQGELVTEVGFFVKNRRYFIRPNEKTDSLDEQTVFRHNLNSFVRELYTDILEEPDFGAEYYREWVAYITEGIDLNPYIDKNNMENSDALQDRQFERTFSYKIDTAPIKEGDSWDILTSENLWLFREQAIDKYIEELQMDYSTIENRKLLPLYLSYKTFSLADLRDYANSIPANPGLHDSELPFLIQAYGEYESQPETQQQNMSFEEFIQNHPAVFYNSDVSLFLLPYVDEEKNIMSRLFRQYNQFEKCIEEHEPNTNPCDKIEDKKAFIKLMLGTYK